MTWNRKPTAAEPPQIQIERSVHTEAETFTQNEPILVQNHATTTEHTSQVHIDSPTPQMTGNEEVAEPVATLIDLEQIHIEPTYITDDHINKPTTQ